MDVKQVDGGQPEENISLTMKRSNYELRRNNANRRVIVSDKYSPDVAVCDIPWPLVCCST